MQIMIMIGEMMGEKFWMNFRIIIKSDEMCVCASVSVPKDLVGIGQNLNSLYFLIFDIF